MFESIAPLDRDVRAAYLARLDVEAGPPSVEALRLIVQRQVERVPYETLWIHAGQNWTIDPHDAAARIALQHRGGYCYHLNGALGLLLSSLGYSVHGHVGGVHGSDGPSADEMGNHLVLTVNGLPSADNPSGVWYVDTGLGDALYDPLPLIAGAHDQPPFRLQLERLDEGSRWHLTHDANGGFAGMTWTSDLARPTDFESKHHWLSTSPDSGFVQVAMAERRDATGVDVVRGLIVSRVGDNAYTAEPVSGRTEWFALVADVFGLHFDEPADRDRLWSSVVASHERWRATQPQ